MSGARILPFPTKPSPIEKIETPKPGLSLTLSVNTDRLAQLLKASLEQRTKAEDS